MKENCTNCKSNKTCDFHKKDMFTACNKYEKQSDIQLTEKQLKEMIDLIEIEYDGFVVDEEITLMNWKEKGWVAEEKKTCNNCGNKEMIQKGCVKINISMDCWKPKENKALEKAREYYSKVEKIIENNELYSINNMRCLKDLYEQAIKELQEKLNVN